MGGGEGIMEIFVLTLYGLAYIGAIYYIYWALRRG